MTKTTSETLKDDIEKRLGDIAFHFEERDTLSRSLSSFTRAESITDSPRKKEVDRVVKRILNEEADILLKLVHLKDSIEKYFKVNRLDVNEIKVIDLFKPYRVASNFVNINKHGLRGRNAKTAVHDYSALVFKQEGKGHASTDRFVGYITVINYDGDLYQTLDVIIDLIRIWELFLRNHTDIDTTNYIHRISQVQSKLKATYSTPMPKGMFRDATRFAMERKSLDIK